METERRFLTTEVRQDEGGSGEISGYAAVFYDGTPGTEYELWDGAVERIMPGAFDGVDERDVVGLFNHHEHSLLGRLSSGTLKLSVDSRGLGYRIAPGNTTTANDVREHIRRGDVSGSSFAFSLREGGEAWTRDGQKNVRELRSLTVYDVGPVVAPAYAGTSAAARNEQATTEAKDSYERHVNAERERRAAELEARLAELGIADEKTVARVDKAITRNRQRGAELRGPHERVENRKCAAQHFGLWCVEPRWLQECVSAVKAGIYPTVRAASDDRFADSDLYEVDREGVAVIPIDGQMTKRGSSYGGASTTFVRRAIRAASRDPEVTAILLHVDSPGGTVAGTDDLANDVRRARSMKPIHTHIDDLGASAAYWVASQTGRISANPTAEVGSIGTLAVVQDLSGAAEKSGIKVHVVATGAHKGDFTPGAPVTDASLDSLREEVNDLNAHFVRAVSKGRSTPIATVREWADGRVFIAAKAKDMGMIDAVERLDDAIKEAAKVGTVVAEQKAKSAERLRIVEEIESIGS